MTRNCSLCSLHEARCIGMNVARHLYIRATPPHPPIAHKLAALPAQLKHFRDQREALTSQLAIANKSREDRERQCSEMQAQLATAASELARMQAWITDREQAAAAAERLHVST